MSGDARLAAFAALATTALVFLVGVRRAFRRPPPGHGYRATLTSGTIFVAEGIAVLVEPVPLARAAAAGALLAAAVALFAWAARVNRAAPLGLAFAGAAAERLQTSGPYALVRHPFYASYLLAFAAGWLAAGTPWLAPVFALGAATYWSAARREERGFLEGALAREYEAYARRVGMLLPRVGRAVAAPPSSARRAPRAP